MNIIKQHFPWARDKLDKPPPENIYFIITKTSRIELSHKEKLNFNLPQTFSARSDIK